MGPSRQAVSSRHVKTVVLVACTCTAALFWLLLLQEEDNTLANSARAKRLPGFYPVIGSEVISVHFSQDTAGVNSDKNKTFQAYF